MKEWIVKQSSFLIGCILVLSGLGFIYRDAFLGHKILFPSNLLVTFYSPWSTVKIKGWEQGVPNKPIGGNDQVRLFYPGRTFTNESIANREFPLWNPYIFSGSPHLANFQSAVFYPLNILYLIFPQIFAWSLLVVIPLFLGFVFMYIFLKSVDCENNAAIIGAIAFGFCGFMSAWTQENAAVGQAGLWLPLMLYSIEKLMREMKLRYILLGSFALAASFLGGFYQIAFYAWVVGFAYALFRLFQQRKLLVKRLIYFLLTFLTAFGFCAIQLIPSAEAFFDSPRGITNVWYLFDLYLRPMTHLIRLIFPDITGNPGAYNYFGQGFYHETLIYVGIIPLLFAIFSAVRLYKKPIVLFFLFLTTISAFLTIKSPFTLWFFKLPVPLVNSFLPSRIFYLTSFGLATLAAFGITAYLKKENDYSEKVLRRIILATGIIMSVPYIFIGLSFLQKYALVGQFFQQIYYPKLSNWRPIMFKNLLFSSSLIFVTYLITILKFRKKSVLLLVFLTAVSQFYFLNKYSVVGFPQFLYPEHFIFSFLSGKNNEGEFFRYLAFGRPILGNVSSDKHVYTPEGLDAVFPYRYAQLVSASKNGGILIKDVPRIEATLSELGLEESILENERRYKLISLLGVKYLFYYLEKPLDEKILPLKFPASSFKQIWSKDNWYAYENLNVQPRVFLVSDYSVEKIPQNLVSNFFSKNFNPAKSVILDEEINGKLESDLSDDAPIAKIVEYKPQYINIKTESKKPKILFLSDNYNPGWSAYIDGKETKIYRADYTFRAVFIPSGMHKITFSYFPKSFKIGLMITLATIVLVLTTSMYLLILKG